MSKSNKPTAAEIRANSELQNTNLNSAEGQKIVDQWEEQREDDDWKPSATNSMSFHNFERNNLFIGLFDGEIKQYRDPLGSEGDWDAYIMTREDKIPFLIARNYQIVKAVEKNGAGWYKILFHEKKKAAKGNVSLFTIWFKKS